MAANWKPSDMSVGAVAAADPLLAGLVCWYRMINPNLVNDSSLEGNQAILGTDGIKTSAYAHSGTYSYRLTGDGTNNKWTYFYTTPGVDNKVPVTAGRKFYAEAWVYGDPANVQASGGTSAITLMGSMIDTTGVNATQYIHISAGGDGTGRLTASTALNGVWTKMSGYITVPAGYDKMGLEFGLLTNVNSGEKYYFDDVVVRAADCIDSSGKGNIAALANSPTLATDKYSNANSAYDFVSASNQCMTLTQTNGLPLYGSGRAYSICAWIKASAPASTWNSIYGEGISGDWQPTFYIGVWSNLKLNVFSLRADGSTMVFANTKSTTTVADDTWHHIVFSDPGTGLAKLYVDGVLDATSFSYTSANYAGFEAMTQSTVAGLRRQGGGVEGPFDGSLSDLRLYNRAITATEANTLATATKRL